MAQCEELKDDDRPSNTLELFLEKDEVLQMIENLKVCHSQNFEKEYEKCNEILSRYQEQPHLLDPHLDLLLSKLLNYIRDPNSEELLVHASFKYIYTLSKVRTYKALVKFLPHELTDLEFVLELLERQDIKNSQHWETRYVLLLWMSIVVLNPFHMARLDAFRTNSENCETNLNHIQPKTKMERIFFICKLYSENNDTCATVAAFLSAKFFIRMDIKEIYLEQFLKWVMMQHDPNTEDAKFGQLAAVAAILKHGKRDDLLPFAENILKWILFCNYKTSSDFLKYKYYIKIIQRLGLVYMKPRVAAWRYKRGSRSLTANLSQFQQNVHTPAVNVEAADDENEEILVPDMIEDVIEELLQALRSASSDVRWCAAKGLGRVTNRLPKSLGDDVIGSVIEIFSPLEPHEAWHGGCLAIAELAKRGLLLPYRLTTMVPLLTQALFYDEMKGYMSVGQNIRDSACYMCWAFARAYDPKDLEPFINEIAAGLLTAAVFDREINCRRAASAAFQESVGRLGNFPHGIDILVVTDFYSVGLRTNSYLQISDFIAQYEEYTQPLIDHLVDKKIGHWDTAIRELAAKALNRLTKRAPIYVANEVLPKLFTKTESLDIATRHGAILAIGEVVLALTNIGTSDSKKYLSNQTVCHLNELIGKFLKRDQFRGMSGEIMKQCCADFIKNCSLANLQTTRDCLDSWQQIVDKCVVNKNSQVRESATSALSELCKAYYNSKERKIENCKILDSYLFGSEHDLEEHIRMGYLHAIGALPKFIIKLRLPEVVNSLVKHALVPHGALQALLSGDTTTRNENSITHSWSEARRSSVRALANVVQTVGFDLHDSESMANPKYLERIIECFLMSLEEYTLDNRGDIGAWVREAAMCALYQLLTTCPHELLRPEYVHQIMVGLAQQAVEKIDRTRGLAGKLFCGLVQHMPRIPHIHHHEKLLEIFPEDSSSVLWLFADHTFPLFCSMLELKEYSERLLLGLSASIGQLTESLIKYSSASLFQFLRAHPFEIPRICSEIVKVFSKNSMKERVTYPMLNFLDILISSGTINNVLMDESMPFADEIFQLVNIEIKGHKKLYKLISSINVFCQLIQVPRLRSKVFSKMAVFLGLTHVHIRKTTATKLYEALALHGDDCGISEEHLDELLTLLSETDWGMPLSEVRPIRNQLCDLMGIKAPISATALTGK